MLRLLIVETGRVSAQSTVAHVRNAIKLSKELGVWHDVKLVDLTTAQEASGQYDVILFSYAGMGCDFTAIDKVIEAQKNCRIGWLTNEFELFANTYVKERMDFIITNFEAHGIKKAHTYRDHLMVNLNTLIFSDVNPKFAKKYDVCYFGTYRKYREEYFKRYFREEFILSTTKKNFKRFADLGLDCVATDKFCVKEGQETLNLFSATLYLEDSKTHTCFNYMANRFYEALQCNTALFFDVSCRNTIVNDAYAVDDYFLVESYEGLMEKVSDIDQDKLSTHTRVNTAIAKIERQKALKKIAGFLEAL